jgi:hypothetical protein
MFLAILAWCRGIILLATQVRHLWSIVEKTALRIGYPPLDFSQLQKPSEAKPAAGEPSAKVEEQKMPEVKQGDAKKVEGVAAAAAEPAVAPAKP